MKARYSMSRRAWLRTAAAMVAAPHIIPASALGKDGRPAPSNRLTMGLIG
ncbi:MAG: gfo/Idh/MocA family oxidoreductase, partial [Verrucomicrobia bacterium]|nr:gfo/Idh/MocA family oxidoreductase [Verrucomicrobiota bacterium]